MPAETTVEDLVEEVRAQRPELPPEEPAPSLPAVATVQQSRQQSQADGGAFFDAPSEAEMQGMISPALLAHMTRVARVMAEASLIPESLWAEKDAAGNKKALPFRTILANCFLIVNQARLWKIDPFALAQATSVVHGRLMFEGKVITAVLESTRGITLRFTWIEGAGDKLGIMVEERNPPEGEDARALPVPGTVGDWKTKKKGGATSDAWTGRDAYNQLAYRGAREWARIHEPGVVMGVLFKGDDEVMSNRLEADQAAAAAPPPMSSGFRPPPSAARRKARKPRFDLNQDEELRAAAADAEAKASQDGPGRPEGAAVPETPAEENSPPAANDAQSTGAFDRFLNSHLPAAQSWEDIRVALQALQGSPAWVGKDPLNARISPEGHQAFAGAWKRMRTLLRESKGRLAVSIVDDMSAFRCCIEAAEDVQQLQLTWDGVRAGEVYAHLKKGQKEHLQFQVADRCRIIEFEAEERAAAEERDNG